MTKQFSNYSDLLTFTRASKGHALRPVSYGSEEVTNGDFATDSDWVKTQATISGGVCEINSPSGSYAGVYQAIPVTAGKMYFISVEVVSVVTGSALVNVEGGSVGTLTTSGLITTAYVATDDTLTVEIKRGGGVTEFTIDNVSVKEVTFDQPDGTLTLFEHPDNIPRVEWDAQRNRLGLLVEEARTNSFTYSEDFSTWSLLGVTVTAGQRQGPDGLQSMTAMTEDTSNALHIVYKGFTTTSSTSYTLSFFVVADGRTEFYLRADTSAGTSRTDFNLSSGTVGAVHTNHDSASIEYMGNSIYRVSVSFTETTGGFRNIGIEAKKQNAAVYVGSGTNALYIYGAQLETGSFPTSYIKSNSGSTTTRSADVASIPVADFGYNQSAGTLLIDYLYQSLGSGELGRYLELGGSNPSQDRILLYLSESSENTALQIRTTGGGTQTGLNVSTPIGQFNKVASGFSKDDVAAVSNGGSAVIDTLADIPANIVELDIGSSSSNIADVGVVYIKSIQYYPRRLTNAQLQALTEPRSTPTLSLTFDGLESSYTENYIHG